MNNKKNVDTKEINIKPLEIEKIKKEEDTSDNPSKDSDYWLDDEDEVLKEDDFVEDFTAEEDLLEDSIADAEDFSTDEIWEEDVEELKTTEENKEPSGKSDIKAKAEKDKITEEKKTDSKRKASQKTSAKLKTGDKKALEKKASRESGEKEKKGHAGKVIGSFFLVFFLIIGAAYIGISVFFISHFYPNTVINGKDFSYKTAEDVERYIQEQIEDYTLTILQKDNQTDVITAEEISLEHKGNNEADKIIEEQNMFAWPLAFSSKKMGKVNIEVSYDKQKLSESLNKIKSLNVEKIEPVSAYPKFDGTKYVIEPEVTGTEVNMETLEKSAAESITNFSSELDMQVKKCYVFPKYTSESKEVKDACDEANKFLQANITYQMKENVVVNSAVISQWITVDTTNLTVTFNEEKVKEWLREFGKTYDTVGKTRTITTPTGKVAEVSGGTYGWEIDEAAEFEALVNSIKSGEVVAREPIYVQRATSYEAQDWGTTYVEVDLSAQHMWAISNGTVVLETPVVTGVPTPKMETPAGVYSILEKLLNTTLVGEIVPGTGEPEYRTPVDYWMRVTWSGIGFHDATWQPAFGGNLYQVGAGSHGCINMPLDQAAALYNWVPVGTPVIIHY